MAATIDPARVHRASTPETIDADLKALWADVGRDAPVARALMANLVVFCHHPAGERADFERPAGVVPIEEVVRRHPSRVLVLHHSGDVAAGGPIAAGIAIVMFGSDATRYGIEQISVRLASSDASLPSVVRSLVRGDVPTSIWWTEDFSMIPPVPALVSMGRQLIYDSRGWADVRRGVLALGPFVSRREPPDFADLNWRRLTVMRQALVHAAGTLVSANRVVGEIRITHGPGERALAWLLAGWLTSRIGDGPENPAVKVAEHAPAAEILTVSVGTIEASMTAQRVIASSEKGAKPFQLAVRYESDADAVAAELGSLSYDVCLRDTLAALGRLFAP
jgi:glucose-6-phosphate dehydrogenase assembly protein OpcA